MPNLGIRETAKLPWHSFARPGLLPTHIMCALILTPPSKKQLSLAPLVPLVCALHVVGAPLQT